MHPNIVKQSALNVLFFLAFAAAFVRAQTETGKPPSPPHIVLFMADDMGWGDVGFNGGTIPTPHLDKLATDGVRLDSFYVQPVCTPTRGALMTGRYPMRLGLQTGVVRPWATHGLPLDERTLADALREAGYTTTIFGKWHLGHSAPKYLPTRRGFDQQLGHYNGAINYFTHQRDGGHDWHKNDTAHYERGYATDLTANAAIDCIAHHDPAKPLFLYVPFSAPHTPLQAPQEWIEKFSHIENVNHRIYAAMIACMDDAIGNILAAMEKHGFARDNTLVFFCSDNGALSNIGSNKPLRGQKAQLYEGGIRVPAVISWPGKLEPGKTVNEPLHIVDLYPTLLRLAGAKLEQEHPLDGRDAWPTIADGRPSPHEVILHNVTPWSGALRMGKWKLLHNGRQFANETQAPAQDIWELFDIQADPGEKNNLIEQNPEIAAQLRARLEAFREAAVPGFTPPNQAPPGFQPPKVWGDTSPRDAGATAPPRKPNILLILADDLGYGDVACYNPNSRVPTPRLDRLAREGLKFTDAHSPATVCTPTRYSILTGRMAFRTGFRSVFTGVGGPCLIEADRLTLPGMLRNHGYATALSGKWHVGITFYDSEGKPIHDNSPEAVKRIDYSRPASDGPIHRGFDHFFGTVSCPTTDWLYAYMEGDRIPVPPTGLIDKSTLPDHAYAHDCREGYIAPGFDLELVDEVFLEYSIGLLKKHAEEKPGQPFFLFHSCQAVHLPSFPAPKYQGKTDAGPHGDFIYQFDATVGRLLDTLEELGIAEDTLVIVTSDNGPELPTVVEMRQTHDHDGAHPWRGVKRDNWEGGHRVPLIIRWPGAVQPGRVTAQTVSLVDLMATVAEIVGHELPEKAGEDSQSILPVLDGSLPESQPLRRYTLQESIRGFSLRDGPWKYLDHQGSGGNNYSAGGLWGAKALALPDSEPNAPAQLYHLGRDPGERENLYFKHPKIVERMKQELESMISRGRITQWPED
jgi:arylsulfatase A-like enzyme